MNRRGVTLFQLLLILAMLALLFALFLPAVLRARAAAARAASQNNLKQIGLACHNYHDANNRLPSGCDDQHFSASAYLLPYIEQDAVFKLIDFKKPCNDKVNANARNLVIKTFLNPRDPQMGVEAGVGATNYLFCSGSTPPLADGDGLMYLNSKVTFNAVTDGLSNTMLAGETLKGNGKTTMRTVERQHIGLERDDLKGLKDDGGVADWKDGKNIVADRCASWIDGRFLIGTFSATRAINDDKPDVSCGGAGGLAGLRGSEGATVILLADGSVRTVLQSVPLETLKNLATRAGGEVINDF